ncbi:MAG: PQQ-dependent sugar dehydrogenase, partial [Chitinophagaceae bacterium]
MRYIYFAIGVIVLAGAIYFFLPKNNYASDDVTLAQGKALFTNNCISCHGLQEDGFGPPLGGVTNLLSKKELVKFINNPSSVVESGDKRAALMMARYKRIMPSYEWMKESEINSMLAYIHHESKLQHIEPIDFKNKNIGSGLKGRLVAPVKKSGLKIELEEVIQLPRLGHSTDLGVVAMRAHPWGDGTLFVNDQNGIIYRIKNGKSSVFLDAAVEIKDFQSGPGIATGIASFAFHPDFLKNGIFYMAHAETYKGQKADYAISLLDTGRSVVQWVVGEWKMDNPRDAAFKGTHRELLRLHAPNFAHGFQDMGFIPELKKNDPDYGLLYFGYGDGGSNNLHHPELGHNLKSFLGTILRIDPAGNNSRNGKYGIPADNPFVNEKDLLTIKEIYAYGFRNPHRFSWDIANGNRMIATDVGEANVEELNIIQKGGDYGWPVREGNYGIASLIDLKTVFKLSPQEFDLYKG